jgi:hypothetical protein
MMQALPAAGKCAAAGKGYAGDSGGAGKSFQAA